MKTTVLFAFAILAAMPVFAGQIELRSSEGAVVVEGNLVARDGELLRVETEFGLVTVDGGYLQCSGTACPDPSDLVARAEFLGTDDLMNRLLPALLEVFAAKHGLEARRNFLDDQTVSWDLRVFGTNRLLAQFSVELLDVDIDEPNLSMSSIHLTRLEAQRPVRQDIIALDALVPAVAPQNPRALVTLAQLRGLLNGNISTWDRLGGPTLQVSVHVPVGWDRQKKPFLPGSLATTARTHRDLKRLSDAIAASPQALGLVPYSSIGNAVPLVVSGACGLATPATRDTIRAEDYPLTQPIFLQRLGAKQQKVVRDFIAFARSPEAQPVIRAAGFVDQAIGRIAFERQGDRIANAVLRVGDDPVGNAEMRDMIGVLLGGERLTLTFRFEDGSSDLDAQSVSNIERLADAISAGVFDGMRLLFVGFSDAAGPREGNLRLSERRARAVRKAVSARLAENSAELELAAFGELMPMACDDTPWGGRVNRRVEVWVKPLEVSR